MFPLLTNYLIWVDSWVIEGEGKNLGKKKTKKEEKRRKEILTVTLYLGRPSHLTDQHGSSRERSKEKEGKKSKKEESHVKLE